jgi:hypothetical protein
MFFLSKFILLLLLIFFCNLQFQHIFDLLLMNCILNLIVRVNKMDDLKDSWFMRRNKYFWPITNLRWVFIIVIVRYLFGTSVGWGPNTERLPIENLNEYIAFSENIDVVKKVWSCGILFLVYVEMFLFVVVVWYLYPTFVFSKCNCPCDCFSIGSKWE